MRFRDLVLGFCAFAVFSGTSGCAFSVKRQEKVFAEKEEEAGPGFSLSAEAAYLRSVELLQEGEQPQAEELLYRACNQYPNNGALHFARGVMRRSRWLKREANGAFIQVLASECDDSLKSAAEIAVALNSGKSAVRFDELVQLAAGQPENIYLQWLLAINCREFSQNRKGAETYARLLERLKPGPVMMHHTYANILTEGLKEYEKALEHRRVALSISRTYWTLQGMGNTLKAMGRYDEAAEYLQCAVSMNPDSAKLRRQLGDALRGAKRWEDALEAYEHAIQIEPLNTGYAWFRAGLCHAQLGNTNMMLMAWNQSDRDGYIQATRRLANYWFFQAGDKEKAYRYLHKWTGETNRLDALGQAASQMRDRVVKWSIGYAKEGIRLDPNHWHCLNSLAHTYCVARNRSVHDYEEALRLAKASVAAAENEINLTTLLIAYEKLGRNAEAAETLTKLECLGQAERAAE
jgi:tetratricopeptide (TPR) repeat protein